MFLIFGGLAFPANLLIGCSKCFGSCWGVCKSEPNTIKRKKKNVQKTCCYIEIMYFPVVVNNCLKSGWSGISNVLNSEIIKTHLNFYLLFSLSFCSTFFLLRSLIFFRVTHGVLNPFIQDSGTSMFWFYFFFRWFKPIKLLMEVLADMNTRIMVFLN